MDNDQFWNLALGNWTLCCPGRVILQAWCVYCSGYVTGQAANMPQRTGHVRILTAISSCLVISLQFLMASTDSERRASIRVIPSSSAVPAHRAWSYTCRGHWLVATPPMPRLTRRCDATAAVKSMGSPTRQCWAGWACSISLPNSSDDKKPLTELSGLYNSAMDSFAILESTA